MTARPHTLVATLALALAACEAGSESAEVETPAGTDDGTDGAPSLSDGSDGAADGTDGTSNVEPAGAAPAQSNVEARVSGRAGYDVTVSLIVEDADRNAQGIRVRALDAGGAELLAFRGGLDDQLDSASASVPFDTTPATASFVGTVTLRGLALEVPSLAQLEVAVFDATGNEVAPGEIVDVLPQPTVAAGDTCDPDTVENRCEAGFGCRGTPAVCSEGLPPEITKVSYLVDATGVRILVAGDEPEDDIAGVTVAFLDAKGQPVEVDLDGDESPDGAEFEVDATGTAANGEFFVAVTPSSAFAEAVPQVSVVAHDAAGHVGAAKTAKQSKPPTKGTGAACDPRGFDVCAATAVCASNTAGTNTTCQARTAVQAKRCEQSPVVVVTGGTQVVSGLAAGASAWEAPVGCASGDPLGRPEGVVTVRLERAHASLRLSTAREGTNFDTVLYVMDQCGTADAKAMSCADDSSEGDLVSAAGALELELVGPGDLTVVVDSWGAAGGTYSLEITAD